MTSTSPPTHVLAITEVPEQRPVVKLVHMVLLLALKDRATDVWFEPQTDYLKLSYRVEGELYEMVPPPPELAGEITAVFQELTYLDISSFKTEQTGQMRVLVAGEGAEVDVVLSATPHGKSIHLTFPANDLSSESVQMVLQEYFQQHALKQPRPSWLQRLWRRLIPGGRNKAQQFQSDADD